MFNYEDDEIFYKRKRKKKKKSNKKSNHKHDYIKTFAHCKEMGIIEIEYCKICGKLYNIYFFNVEPTENDKIIDMPKEWNIWKDKYLPLGVIDD